jgi:ubiquinone/menaquinone biosynthesis C-methylase UbiE
MPAAPPSKPTAETLGQKFVRYTEARREFWDRLALNLDRWLPIVSYYQLRLAAIYQFLIPKGASVLEIGCAQGDLLAAVKPARGVGVDFSPKMIERAQTRHAHLSFVEGDAHELPLEERFDYIICADLLNELWDVQRVLQECARVSKPSTRLIVNTYSRIWELPRRLGERLGIFRPQLQQNWLTPSDVEHLLQLAGFEVIRQSSEFLWPFGTPLVAPLFNRVLVKLWPFRWFAFKYFLIARPVETPRLDVVVSVIVPARNEAGNIQAVFDRLPQMGLGTELIFVEGNSQDDTFAAIQAAIKKHPHWKAHLYKQPGKGKGDAVRLGFDQASGGLLMILDADLTVAPEDLPRFYAAWKEGKADFVNGVRLVYPAEQEAFRFFNLIGNRFFSLTFQWLLGQRIKDTLCGTKVLSKEDYGKIAANRSYFGDFDPFGDFDLIFGAAKYNLKIVDLPIRYQARTYGETNIQRWRHGAILLRMAALAMGRIKFI